MGACMCQGKVDAGNPAVSLKVLPTDIRQRVSPRIEVLDFRIGSGWVVTNLQPNLLLRERTTCHLLHHHQFLLGCWLEVLLIKGLASYTCPIKLLGSHVKTFRIWWWCHEGLGEIAELWLATPA